MRNYRHIYKIIHVTVDVLTMQGHLTVILSRNVTVKNIKRGTLFLVMINNNNIVFLLKRKLNSQAVKNKYNIQSILIGPMLIKPMIVGLISDN
jgi:negative regulator of sigma E activity